MIQMKLTQFLIIILVVIGGHSALAAMNVTDNGVAIRGYDPVAYFSKNVAIKGDPEFRLKTKDDIYWLFVSQSNRDLFVENPEKYMPQYGGFCAFAMGYRVKAAADPQVFTVYDGKLYLNQTELVKKRWLRQQDVLISLGDQYWPRFK